LKISISILLFIIGIGLTSQPRFKDVTDLQTFVNFDPAWTYGCGVSAVDYDADGDIDLYLLANENSTNRLYQNDGSGNYTEVQGELALQMRSRTALWFDIDQDNRLDVLVAGDCASSNLSCLDADNIVLYLQLDNGSFEDVTASSGLLSGRSISGVFGGLAAGDINNDGILDLVMTQWAGEIKLYEGNGDGTFTDITVASGLEKPSRYWQPVLFDLNKDGWADIYLTVDNERNLFYQNNKDGTFTEKAIPVNLDNAHNDMGIAIGDYDGDDDFDIYISNIERDRDGDHNVLLKSDLQNGNFTFSEVSKDFGVDQGGWGWGVTFLDADNDGLLDIAATNGWVTDFSDPSKLWKNTGIGFDDVSEMSGFNDTLQATTLLSFDMDRDGDLDLAQSLKGNPGQTLAFRLLENQLNESSEFGNYLVVKPRMTGSNHWAIGATIKIETENGLQTRPITAGISFYGQEPAEAHFGLGDLVLVDTVTIIWPGGATSSVYNIAANSVITVDDADALHVTGTISAVAKSSSEIQLAWGHMSTFETHFIIERAASASFENAEVIPSVSKQRTFLDTGLEPFTTYYYRVRATNGNVVSGFGNIASQRTLSDVIIETPTNLEGKVVSQTSVEIKWVDQAANEEGYTIQRSLDKNFARYLTFDLPENAERFFNSNIEPHTTYFYRVQAYRVDGTSEFSNEIEMTTIVLGLNDSKSLLIYPNPSGGSFQIALNELLPNACQVNLISLSGSTVGKWSFPNSESIEKAAFSVQLPTGIYFIRITSLGYNEVIQIRVN
jgi:hypothetical protein